MHRKQVGVTENEIQLFEERRKIYPVTVKGKYRTLKNYAIVILLGIYYIVPWLRWDRGMHAPDQAVLIDMPGRRAYFFFIEIWPQEVYILTGILVLAAVGLFFATSLFGRVWCGYACPQTVWTDLFIMVENIFQGDRNKRMRLDKAPWGFNKIWRKTATHIVWILIGLLTGGAWVFYFNDAPTLLEQMIYFEAPWSVMGWVWGLTLSTYIMAGHAREQVCTYMCPYARFQSAMFDKDTLIIGYDVERGEPRGHMKKGASRQGRGDCIDCNRCVQVCPTGIDIREGLQMECIACGLCIDACNEIMDKVDLPRGLIRYDTAHNLSLPDEKKRFRILRLRTFYYTAIMSVVGALMLSALIFRAPATLTVLHDRNPLFVLLSDGSVRNGYTIKILNKTHQDRTYTLAVSGLEEYDTAIYGAGNAHMQELPVFADSVGEYRVFISAPEQQRVRQGITFTLSGPNDLTQEVESVFISRRP